MTTCGLCGQKTRHIGSHVQNVHVRYGAGQDAITAALAAERAARRPAWFAGLTAVDMTYGTGR